MSMYRPARPIIRPTTRAAMLQYKADSIKKSPNKAAVNTQIAISRHCIITSWFLLRNWYPFCWGLPHLIMIILIMRSLTSILQQPTQLSFHPARMAIIHLCDNYLLLSRINNVGISKECDNHRNPIKPRGLGSQAFSSNCKYHEKYYERYWYRTHICFPLSQYQASNFTKTNSDHYQVNQTIKTELIVII